jgi:acyl-CoA thioesterase
MNPPLNVLPQKNETLLAEAVTSWMFTRDYASQSLGIKIAGIGPGYSKLKMRVRPSMNNGHGICHGGVVFSLADSAFAFACNSRNQKTVAAGCSIDFLASARVGDDLCAETIEESLQGRTGIYDVVVTDQGGKRIALFRGRSHRVEGEVMGRLTVGHRA